MFEELHLEGYQGGYDNVRRYARAWAAREGEPTAVAYVPLSFAAGEAYQFDWRHEVPSRLSSPGTLFMWWTRWRRMNADSVVEFAR